LEEHKITLSVYGNAAVVRFSIINQRMLVVVCVNKGLKDSWWNCRGFLRWR